MLFCPKNDTLFPAWSNHGISLCFMETISISIIGLFMVIFGSGQMIVYRKYSTRLLSLPLRRKKLYNVQIFITFLLPLVTMLRFLLEAFLLKTRVIYGYMVLELLVSLFIYPFSFALVYAERHYQLPSVPSKGHGFVLLLFWTMVFVSENLSLMNIKKPEWWFHGKTLSDKVEVSFFITRYLSCLLLFVLGLRAPGIPSTRDYMDLNHSNVPQDRDSVSRGSTWRNFFKKVRILAPFLWPKKDVLLQFRVFVCFLLLACGRAVNLYVPIYSKLIVDSMTLVPLQFRWDYVVIYVFFKFLQGGGTGGMGVLNNLRSFLWVRIQQYTTREVEVDLFRHIHTLSLRWHLSRKTGEVTRMMDRGTDSINNILSYVLFSIAPCIVDIFIAVLYFVTYFNFYFGIIVFVTMAFYLAATIVVTEWRTKFQRAMNLADNATKAKCTDSLLNYETVKYYGAEDFEVDNYKKAVLHFQKEEWKSAVTLNILNTLQNIIICGGLLAGSLLCVHMVVTGQDLTVGDYVLFSSYIVQLYVPLNWFGTYYRMIQKNFIDMENMFDLLKESREVEDVPDAPDLQLKLGHIQFQNVSFGYQPERIVLKNISFEIPPGKTIALVGPSGSGKSTIIRLLFRFYDVSEGVISIDGQDIRLVKQLSVRNAIGIVPQDTVLFNNTVKYNIQYGRLSAGDADIINSAKQADIHNRILTFPNGYDTEVGERGLKLSGGEKQRVTIARTILKSPQIILLDEATSSLDTQTERNIQAAMNQAWKDRTMLIVAHRLSTVVNADEIIVLKDGEIIERGSHDVLLERGSVYSKMWADQLKKDQPETTST
ncbi:hypothetical protein RUM43_008302 [Polyplax serrata]|uniref:ATP-binding cassette sub-family B member 6 n=1 Tax=Polyplax serrata TaxID=468196 RepID=A0AAN8PAF5_POLSC